jgi:hypothetical protein
LTLAVGVAGMVCLSVFPAFAHFFFGVRWEVGVFTGWVGRMAWVKGRRP